jgi:hypothetical protein
MADNAYSVQIVTIYATHWRYSGKSVPDASADLDLGERLLDFYKLFSDQLPHVINHRRRLPAQSIRFVLPDGTDRHIDGMTSAEILIFALPFPADQVVASLRVEIDSPDINEDSSLVTDVLELCANTRFTIEGANLATYIDKLVPERVRPDTVVKHDIATDGQLPLERHQLVLIGDLGGAAPPEAHVVTQILYQINPPYRSEFTVLKRPDGLNREERAYCAVSPAISFLYGHPDDVENSVFLTAVQAIGTASRFQQIWQDAYQRVRDFQVHKQAKETGKQQRKDLEVLADEMGNLELDLAFSVETAADLGLRIPSSRIEDFHEDLYEVMQIRTRAHSVSQMFVRLGGSIRSELTAIESRERQEEEERRLRGAVAFGALSFVIAPISFIIGFFGINTSQIHGTSSMWNWRYYHWAYIAAIVLALIPIVVFIGLYGKTLLHKQRERRAAKKQEKKEQEKKEQDMTEQDMTAPQAAVA